MLRKRWQKLLLDELEKSIGKRKLRQLKNKLYKEKKENFYVYGKGEVKSEKAAIQYVGRYTGRPAMAESRIISYDGEKVTYYLYLALLEKGWTMNDIDTMDIVYYLKLLNKGLKDKKMYIDSVL